MAEAVIRMPDALRGVRNLFLDTAPVIYYVEGNPRYASIMHDVFSHIEAGEIFAITSPVTLAECITHPIKHHLPDLVQRFTHVILRGKHTRFVETDSIVAQSTAQLRASYSLALADAMQLATAIVTRCDGFLTNDARLKRVSEIRVIIIDELAA
jgi:predicted nucleic acid-binding protein